MTQKVKKQGNGIPKCRILHPRLTVVYLHVASCRATYMNNECQFMRNSWQQLLVLTYFNGC